MFLKCGVCMMLDRINLLQCTCAGMAIMHSCRFVTTSREFSLLVSQPASTSLDNVFMDRMPGSGRRLVAVCKPDRNVFLP